MGTLCPKAPPPPTREEVAARLRADEDAAAAERRRAWVEVANGGTPPPTARAARGGGDRDAPGGERDDGRGGDGTLNLAEVKRAHGPDLFTLLLWLDGVLAEQGFPGISPWWLSFLRAFYASGKRWAVVMAGRGAGKSTVLTRVAVVESLFGERKIPPGQRWIWPFISVGVPDARRRILEIQAILTAIGVCEMRRVKEGTKSVEKWFPLEPSYPQGVPTIETKDAAGNDIAFVALAGTIAGVSGPSSIGATIDEEAKLRDKATNANPATEILASLVQTFRARPGIRAIRCSSAWEEEGSHFGSIDAGSNLVNHVASIGAAFLPDVLAGHEAVASWEASQGNAKGAAQIRAFAATLTANSPNVPTWLGNPTIAAVASRIEVEALPPTALDGLDPTTWWLRENGSLPQPVGATGGGLPLADVEPVVDGRPFSPVDVVMGVAPPKTGLTWGRVLVGIDGAGRMRVLDDASGAEAFDPARYAYSLAATRGTSVLAVAKPFADILTAHLGAAYMGGVAVAAPVAPVDVYDGDALRVGPLRDLYARGKVAHSDAQGALTQAIRGFREDERSPRVEALVAAVARLVACYPWLGAQDGEPEPMRGARAIEGMTTGSGDSAREMLRRLGARP